MEHVGTQKHTGLKQILMEKSGEKTKVFAWKKPVILGSYISGSIFLIQREKFQNNGMLKKGFSECNLN